MTVDAAPPAEDNLARRLGLGPGAVVGERYEILRLLGEGGMGAVFEAKHRVLGRTVAIKILKPEIAQQEQFSARFLQEAKAAAELHHRNIVDLTDYGIDGDRPYMVMEVLRGESLDAMMDRVGCLSVEQVVAIIDPVLRGLGVAHERGIIHRDIKPDNIFLSREDEGEEPVPKIVDFGIAKRTEENVALTTANVALGTPAYMAPEQIASSRTVTPLADQYAVGMTMYEALTTRYAYDAETFNAFIVAKATQDAIPLHTYRPDIDPAFAAVVMRTLSRRPEDRFPSIAALREALQPWRHGSSHRPPAQSSVPSPRHSVPPHLRAPTPAGQHVTGPAALAVTPPSFPTPMNLGTGAHGESVVPAPIEPSVPAPPSSRAGLWMGLAALLIAAGVAVAVAQMASANSNPTPPAQQPPPPQQRPTPPPVDPAHRAMFVIRVEPSSAQIKLDDEVIGVGRAEVVRPRDGRRYQLSITAPGYSPLSEVISAESDVDLRRTLSLLPPNVRNPPPAQRPPSIPPQHAGHAPTPPVVPLHAAPTPPVQTPTPPAQAPTPPAQRPPTDPRHPQIDTSNPFKTS